MLLRFRARWVCRSMNYRSSFEARISSCLELRSPLTGLVFGPRNQKARGSQYQEPVNIYGPLLLRCQMSTFLSGLAGGATGGAGGAGPRAPASGGLFQVVSLVFALW